MNDKVTDNESEAETILHIKRTSEEFFEEFFPRHKDSQSTFSDVEKLTGDFVARRLKTLEGIGGDEVRLMANGHPLINVVMAEWKSGGMFKKNVKGVFFIWHGGIKSPGVALTIAELNAFLKSNNLDDVANVRWVGVAESKLNLGELNGRLNNEAPLFFTNTEDWQACDINYNLKDVSYDNAAKTIVFNVEDRLFT